jgi:hypothetical protein
MIKLRTKESLMREVFERISENKPFDKNLKPYKEDLLKKILDHFEEKEDYEKCQVISNFLNKRFNHITNYLK